MFQLERAANLLPHGWQRPARAAGLWESRQFIRHDGRVMNRCVGRFWLTVSRSETACLSQF